LNEIIKIIRKINKIEKDISENQTLISTILPLFQYLDWDIFDEERVVFEDTTSTKKRVDATFIGKDRKFIIEAKRFSRKLSMKDFEQLTVYINSDETINFGLLTNGYEYWLADNKREGLENKLIYKFDVKDLTECDLNILKKFLSYDAKYEIEDITKYIQYIEMGQAFGDKECLKIFSVPQEEENKKDDLIPTKEDFNSALPLDDVENEINELQNELKEELQEEEKTEKVEDSEEPKKKVESSKNLDEVEILDREKDEDENLQYFDLISKNEVKIFFLEQFHIIRDIDFSSLSIKIWKYIFDKLKETPALYQDIVTTFDFIIPTGDRNLHSGVYENIGNGIYFNSNVPHVEKMKNIEAVLKHLHKQ
jgi:hypothetical protein